MKKSHKARRYCRARRSVYLHEQEFFQDWMKERGYTWPVQVWQQENMAAEYYRYEFTQGGKDMKQTNSTTGLRLVERLNKGGSWDVITMSELHEGDIVRLDGVDNVVYRLTRAPKLGEIVSGVWNIHAEQIHMENV